MLAFKMYKWNHINSLLFTILFLLNYLNQKGRIRVVEKTIKLSEFIVLHVQLINKNQIIQLC